MKAPLLVSACLAGVACRYDGGANTVPAIEALVQTGLAFPLCPEVLGDLPVPRPPCERLGRRVLDRDGEDRGSAFWRGARLGLARAREQGCSAAVLKARSPSCGVGVIYDGTFSHTRIPGDGVFAELLRSAGFTLYTEEDAPESVLGGGNPSLQKTMLF